MPPSSCWRLAAPLALLASVAAGKGSGPGPGGCRARPSVVVLASLPSARSFFAIPPSALGGLLGRRSPAPPAVPPSRLAARQGFGVNRSFRAASAVPSGALGRPLPARPFGRLSALLCSGLPLGPVGPAPPSASWARSRVGRGAFRRGRRGLARFMAGGRPLCGFAARGFGARPGPLLLSRFCVGWWGRGPVRPGRASCHTIRPPRACRLCR